MTDPLEQAVQDARGELLRCPSGCECREYPDAADANECACDGLCCTADWEPWLERTKSALTRLETLASLAHTRAALLRVGCNVVRQSPYDSITCIAFDAMLRKGDSVGLEADEYCPPCAELRRVEEEIRGVVTSADADSRP